MTIFIIIKKKNSLLCYNCPIMHISVVCVYFLYCLIIPIVQMSKFPFKIEEVDDELKPLMRQLYTDPYVQVGEKKWFTRPIFKKYAPAFYHFIPRSTDVWLLGYGRSGTTVTQELLWLLCNNLDFKTAEEVLIRERFPSLEHIMFFDEEDNHFTTFKQNQIVMNSWLHLQETQEKRLIKSHLPFDLLPENLVESGAKIVYIIRDPKDLVISNYHIYKKFSQLPVFPEFAVFWECFKKNLVLWGPYAEHVKEAWGKKDHKNILLIYYDDLVRRQAATIKIVANFLGNPISEMQVEQIQKHLNSVTFQKNPNLVDGPNEKFTLKSEDEWKKYFVGDLAKDLDQWMEENFRGTNIFRN